MSVITYNGVALPYGFITQFNQESVYDDSGTDRMYTRFDIVVQSVVNLNYLQYTIANIQTANSEDRLAPDPRPANAADMMSLLRALLLKPRRLLSVRFNGVELIPYAQNFVPPPSPGTAAPGATLQNNVGSNHPGTVDSKNGPQPQFCNITNLTNNTFLLSWRVIAHYAECPVYSTNSPVAINAGQGNAVLSNRWTETQELDSCQFSTRTRTGKYVIRSDNNGVPYTVPSITDGAIADDLRTQMAVVGVLPGFLRKKASYTISPDGLALSYTLVDEEQFRMPPNPAFEADGYYHEYTVPPANACRFGEVYVRLRGDKNTAQEALIINGLTLAGTVLIGRPGGSYIENCSVRFGIFHNWVEIRARSRLFAFGSRFAGLAAFYNWDIVNQQLSATPQNGGPATALLDPKYQPAYSDRGTAGSWNALLRAAAYYDPTLADNFVDDTTAQFVAGLDIGKAGLNQEL